MMKKTLIFLLNIFLILHSNEITSTVNYPVGALGPQWRFPSDHLPVGVKIEKHKFVSWNILETNYLFHIYENGQGLNESLITELDYFIDGTSLTARDQLVINHLFTLLNSDHTLLALEEVSLPVFNFLKEHLPEPFKLSQEEFNEDIFIYNSNVFDLLALEAIPYNISKKTILCLTLIDKESLEKYQFFQSHVPGGPVNSPPARKEFVTAVLNRLDREATALLMGDMNRSPDYFLNDLDKVAREKEISNPFIILWIPYPTHIDTTMSATWIDNLLISNPRGLRVEIETEEDLPFIQETVSLLKAFER